MTDYVFDTNILIDYLKRPEMIEIYFERVRTGEDTAAFSTITEAELWEGVRNPLEARALREVLRELVRIPVGHGLPESLASCDGDMPMTNGIECVMIGCQCQMPLSPRLRLSPDAES